MNKIYTEKIVGFDNMHNYLIGKMYFAERNNKTEILQGAAGFGFTYIKNNKGEDRFIAQKTKGEKIVKPKAKYQLFIDDFL